MRSRTASVKIAFREGNEISKGFTFSVRSGLSLLVFCLCQLYFKIKCGRIFDHTVNPRLYCLLEKPASSCGVAQP